MCYRNLKAEMKRNDLRVASVANAIHKSVSATSKNLNGKGQFSVEESLIIRNRFFPDCTMDYLFSTEKSAAAN